MKNYINFRDLLVESLRDHREATAYLKAVLEDYKGDEESQKILLLALEDIAKAQGYQLKSLAEFKKEQLSKLINNKNENKLAAILHGFLNEIGHKVELIPATKQ